MKIINKVKREEIACCGISDEYIFKEMLHKLISDSPIDNLKQLFICKKYDPSEIDINKLHPIDFDFYNHLKYEKLIQYEIETK